MRKNKKSLIKKENNTPIRVLYKQVDKKPVVKFIKDINKFKKAIVTRKLDIIPYQNVYIVCNNKQVMKHLPINIILDLRHIAGDLIIIQINNKKREFESISQDDVIWFTNDLMNKIPLKNVNNNYNNLYSFFQKNSKSSTLDITNNNYIFQETLINVLNKIVSALSNFNSGGKNE